MKKLVVIALVATMMITVMGCANKEVAAPAAENEQEIIGDEGIPEDEFIPSNSFEERVGRDRFDSTDEIIGLLEEPERYAFVNIKGSDEPVLVIATETFGGEELGYTGAMTVYPYFKLADGKFHSGSVFFTDSTGTPIAISDDGIVYCAQHNSMKTLCFGDNGTDVKGIMCMKYVFVEYDENGNPQNYGGFVRDKNTVVDNDGEEIAADDEAAFKQAFEEYEKCTVIDFTPAK